MSSQEDDELCRLLKLRDEAAEVAAKLRGWLDHPEISERDKAQARELSDKLTAACGVLERLVREE